MWLCEKIDEQGIGNGISMILFANIVSGLPSITVQFIYTLTGATKVAAWAKWVLGIGTLLIVVGSLIFVTYMSDTERRIPVQYAKRVVGRKMYGGQSSNLPIKLNMAGVMPIIFASTIVSFFPTVMYFVESIRGEEFKQGTFWYGFKHVFDSDSAVYIILLFVLIIAFAYFYISISFNPVEVSNNLMQQGGFIPGIRPGKPTAQYIKKVLNKIILMGAFILALIACVPLIINAVSGGLLGVVSFSGSTLLIVVGVILETFRELEAQMTMRHYKGFLE
jgi:preprotein translocase subunit SecY